MKTVFAILIALLIAGCGPSELELRVQHAETRIILSHDVTEKLEALVREDEKIIAGNIEKIEALRQRQRADEELILHLQKMEGPLLALQALVEKDRAETSAKLTELGLRVIELQELTAKKKNKK